MSASGVVVQGMLAGISLALLVLFGYPETGMGMAGAAVLIALLLWAFNAGAQRRQLVRATIGLVPTVAAALIALPTLALTAAPDTVEGAPEHELAVFAITVLGSVVFLVMWLSTVIDWCYVRPRLAGGMGKRPCTHSLDPCWGRLTRLWFLHRLVAAITLVGATITIVAVAANEWVLGLNQVVAAALAAAATVLAGFYLSRLPFAVAMVGHPPMSVGDKIQLAEMFPQPTSCPHYYVSEISLEGVKLVELAGADERARRSSGRSHDRLLDLADIHKLLRVRDTFAPCRDCKGVNPYCGRAHPAAPSS